MSQIRTVAAVVAILSSGGETHWFACDFAFSDGKCVVVIADVQYEISPIQVMVREPERKQNLVKAGMPENIIICNRRKVDDAQKADPDSSELLAFLQSQPDVDVDVEEDPAAPVVALPMLEEEPAFVTEPPTTIDGEGDSALQAIVDEALWNWSEQLVVDTSDGRFAYLTQGGKLDQVLLPFVAALLAGNVPVYFIVRFPDFPVELHAAGEHTVFTFAETVAYAIQKLAQYHVQLLKEIARRFTLSEIQNIQQHPNAYVIRWQGGITPPQVVELLNSGKKKKMVVAADAQPSVTT